MKLTCSACGHVTEADAATWRCPACASPLAWASPDQFDRTMIDTGQPGMWRYWRSFPVAVEHAVTLHEPMTPLAPMTIDGFDVLAKLDGMLPTGSFKDRGMSVLISFLAGHGVTRVVEDSSGNAAAAVAGYSARAGIACEVYAPATASPGKLVQAAAYGAVVRAIEGTRDDVSHAAEIAAEKPGNAYATHNWHPFFVEGVKSWAFEVWEQLGFEAPDVIVAPAGSGSIVLSAYRAFSELIAAGEIAVMPRLFAAQAAACAPLVTAIETGAHETDQFTRTRSIAEGIMIANPVRGRELLHAIRASNGGAIALSEPAIKTALIDAAHQGIYIEPTSAVAVAALRKLMSTGAIALTDRVVVMLSGNGLKATEAIGEMLRG